MKRAEQVLRTPLHEAHLAAGARLVDFAGWQMPVQYSGVIDEHMAVRTRAGLFDVSHMGQASVSGAEALEFLQRVTCNNVAKLKPGRCHYNALTTPQGTFVDDLLIYMLGEQEYLLVLNAANTAKDLVWLGRHQSEFDVSLSDVSGDWALLALQGPRSLEILQPLAEADPGGLRYYRFARTEVRGVPCIVSRTGYTGEDGFEIYAPPDAADGLWRALLDSGRDHGLAPAGLGARDTLRLEAKMTLYGNDIDDTTTVLEADLGWIVRLDKGEFIGRDVLLRQMEHGADRKLVGFETRGRAVARHGYPALSGGVQVGRVTSGTFAPYLKKNIGLAYLPLALGGIGTEFEVEIRGRREGAVVVETPFYKRPR